MERKLMPEAVSRAAPRRADDSIAGKFQTEQPEFSDDPITIYF
jgi:hypothetical protein